MLVRLRKYEHAHKWACCTSQYQSKTGWWPIGHHHSREIFIKKKYSDASEIIFPEFCKTRMIPKVHLHTFSSNTSRYDFIVGRDILKLGLFWTMPNHASCGTVYPSLWPCQHPRQYPHQRSRISHACIPSQRITQPVRKKSSRQNTNLFPQTK